MSATTVRYSKLVTTDLVNNAINFAESGAMGHRVQIPMSVDDLNTFFVWDRPVGSSRAVGHFNSTGVSGKDFNTMLLSSLSRVYTDIDSVTNGLSFSSAILDANTDGRIRKGGNVSSNDLVMAYVLYKCYGSSAAPTKEVIYNLEDAQEMLTNEILLTSIRTSFNTEEALSGSPGLNKGAVDAMFRDLLASDPMRFFDARGNQIGGIFETNADASSTGSWGFVENDKIEMRVQFRFTNSVTRRGVQDPTQDIATAANTEDTETVVIAAGSTFTIRLQIIATDTQAGAAAKAAASSTAIADALAAEVAATARAVSNAQAASRAAELARQAAASQTAAAQARYAKAVSDNAAQATAAAAAMAAAAAAKALCDEALASGKTESEIQNQRAAAVAAQAAANNAKAIADAAAADLQNAKNAMEVSIAALAKAQTDAATATAAVAKANAAASAASLAKSQSDAAALADSKAAADAASDPFTKNLTDAEKKILDPRTVSDALALANSVTNARLAAQQKDQTAASALAAATSAALKATQDLAVAISNGSTASDIQILRAASVTAAANKEAAQVVAVSANNDLIAALNSEDAAIAAWSKALTDANTLSVNLANANVNAKQRVYDDASGAYTHANGLYISAQAATAVAQATLAAAIAAGATATETQVKQAAVLSCQAAEDLAKKEKDRTAVAKEQANVALTAANTAATAASSKQDADDGVISAQTINFLAIRTSAITEQRTYTTAATRNATISNLVSLHIIKINAAVAQEQANAAYDAANDAVNVAITSGKTVPEVLALRTALQKAATVKSVATSALETAFQNWNVAKTAAGVGSQEDPSGAAILDGAAAALIVQITNAKVNTLVATYFSAKNAAIQAREAANNAASVLSVAQKALEQAILSGATLGEISDLRKAALDAAAASDRAENLANTTEASFDVAQGEINADPTAVAILDATLEIQAAATTAAETSELNIILMKAYENDMNAMKNYTITTIAQQTAEAAVADANNGGASVETLSTLVLASMDAAKRASDALAVKIRMDNALSTALEWVGVSADPSGVLALSTSRDAISSFAFAAQANDLVNAYMRLYTIWVNSKSATLAAKAKYDVDVAALNTAITQGAGVSAIAALQATVTASANALATATNAETLANTARLYALGDVNANASAVAILNQAGTLQTTIINGAKSNMLVTAYLNALAASNAATVGFDSARNVSMLAQSTMNMAILSGNSIAEIQNARNAAQAAAAKEAESRAAMDAAHAAANNARGTLEVDGGAIAILQSTMNAQEAAISGAAANARAKAYFQAKAAHVAALADSTTKQAAYDVATTALDQAITAGASIEAIRALRTTAQTAGEAASNALRLSNAAKAAADAAALEANKDPNAAAILQLQMEYDANRIALAKANSLLALYISAMARAAELNHSYELAREASTIAQNALDAAIVSGAGIDVIQGLRDTAVQTATNSAIAKAAADAATAAAYQSRTNASYDAIASAIMDAQRQFGLRATGLALVNADRIAATNAYTYLSAIKEQALYEQGLLNAAQTAVSAGISAGLVAQEIVNLQAAAQTAALTYASTMASVSSFASYSTMTVATLNRDLAAYNAIAYPITDLAILDVFEVNLVGFGQQMISDDYTTLYFRPDTAQTIKTAIAGDDLNDNILVDLPIVGTGVGNVSTLISTVEIVASNPLTDSIYSSISMYTSSIKMTFTSPVSVGDTRFFIVTGRGALNGNN
jgi:hypothetical protein